MLAVAAERGEAPFLVLCDEISDPHNLGAIIRTAECVGAHGVIIPKRRSAGLTAIVDKASAGALEHMAIARVPNLVAAIETLKKKRGRLCGCLSRGPPCGSENRRARRGAAGAAAVRAAGDEGIIVRHARAGHREPAGGAREHRAVRARRGGNGGADRASAAEAPRAFSRRRLRDTERLYAEESGEEPQPEEPDEPEDFFTEDFGERDDTPSRTRASWPPTTATTRAVMGLRSAGQRCSSPRFLVARAAARPFSASCLRCSPGKGCSAACRSSLPSYLSASSDATCSFMPSSSSARGRSPMSCFSSLACAVTLADTALDFFPARARRVLRSRHAVAMPA